MPPCMAMSLNNYKLRRAGRRRACTRRCCNPSQLLAANTATDCNTPLAVLLEKDTLRRVATQHCNGSAPCSAGLRAATLQRGYKVAAIMQMEIALRRWTSQEGRHTPPPPPVTPLPPPVLTWGSHIRPHAIRRHVRLELEAGEPLLYLGRLK
eukprot:scaffold9109_cov48-Phaeocystis_antarctica.AAC.4